MAGGTQVWAIAFSPCKSREERTGPREPVQSQSASSTLRPGGPSTPSTLRAVPLERAENLVHLEQAESR